MKHSLLEDWIAPQLDELRQFELLRSPFECRTDLLDFSSNDYLGLRTHTISGTAGSGGSPHITGVHESSAALLRELTRFFDVEAGVLLSSGYCANVGVIQALAPLVDDIVSDELNHASIVDGCRLARPKPVHVFSHRSLEALDELLLTLRGRRVLVIVESYYSMDADSFDLRQLDALVREHGSAVLMVDEAHAIGVFGAGRGLCNSAGIAPDILVCTFGKALGSYGAFVGGTRFLASCLWNHCRPLMFSTGASPAIHDKVRVNLHAVKSGVPIRKLDDNVRFFRNRLAEKGITTLPASYGPIVPVQFENARTALSLREALLSQKILVGAVRPPTIPRGGRLRIVIHADHSHDDLDRLCTLLAKETPL